MKPADWRTELHYEYDFRDTFHSRAETELGLHMDECTLLVIQDAKWKYVHFTTLPPLLFDLERDPGQFTNLAEDPAHAAIAKEYAQKALSWRMFHADRTLTHYRASPNGLERRTPPQKGEPQ
jgi:arylsulfatase A-like enzyme